MVKFRKYKDTQSLGTKYIFGVNLYDMKHQPTLDIIIGKNVFVFFVVRRKHEDNN